MTVSRMRWSWRFACAVRALIIGLLLMPCAASGAPERAYRIGLTPVFLDNRASFLKAWRNYLQAQLGADVEFVQRRTYREITELVLSQSLDAAWICGFPFVRNQGRMRLLAVPLYRNRPLYQSYLIVSASDRKTRDILDLKGKIFAYSDPDSNSGFLVPQVRLLRARLDPGRFFARSFFSWTHRDVVLAVAEGVADGGAVDGYVWETLKLLRPELASQTRVASKSEPFGFPPFVTRATLPVADFQALQAAMLGMTGHAQGRALLRDLNLDGFVAGNTELFDSIRHAVTTLDRG